MAPRTQGSPRDNLATGILAFRVTSAVPSVRYGPGVVVCVSNSTGTCLALNTTGTTWIYFSKTSVLA